jgi:asparagine synthase (glutamine-hydrolysing)
MAGFAIVVSRDGKPVPSAIVETLRQSLVHRAPDGIDVTVRGPVAVLAGRLHATPEAHLERQPILGPTGSLLVADVRLDNRQELMATLGWSRPGATTTDVDLLAACHASYGDRMGEVLVGDFAAVVLEPYGRILGVRDHIGVKPLYYWSSSRWIVLASELRQIAAHPEAPCDTDAGMFGQYLSGHVESTTDTVVAGVRRLPAAHFLTIDSAGENIRRYWTPSFDDPIELPSREAYQDRFRELLAEAVQCRLRSAGPVAAELSGGLDSTSVTAMAARLTRSASVPGPGILAMSCVFPWSTRADESRYIREAVDALDVEWTPVVDDAERPPWAWSDAAFWSDVPLPPDGPDHVRLCETARERGCAVVLTGHGGDQSFDPTPFAVPELVQDRRYLSAWRMSAAVGGTRARLSLLARAGKLHHRPRGAGPRAAAVTGSARSMSGIDDRPSAGQLPRAFGRHRAQGHFEQFGGGYHAMSLEIFDRIAARAGVEYRHPYLDRRLVEFGCRVPVWVHATAWANRCLQRGALRELLPPGVAGRTSKARFSEVWLRDIETHLPHAAAWSSSLVVSNGWIDPRRADAALERTRERVAGASGAGPIFMLWGMVQAEAVLQASAQRVRTVAGPASGEV